MEFTRNYLVHYYEIDGNRRLSLPSLIQYFTDIALLNSSSVGLGLDYYDANKTGWMLLKWDIKINSLPVFGETVRVATHLHAMKKFLADREFSLTSADGTALVEARAIFLFVDTLKRRPIRVPDDQYPLFTVSKESEAVFVMPEDLCPAVASDSPAEAVHRLSVRAANTHIDTNAHVNNVTYVEWALDSLPGEICSLCIPAALRVQYKKELNLADEAEVVSVVGAQKSDAGFTTSHSIWKGGDEICALEIDWKTMA